MECDTLVFETFLAPILGAPSLQYGVFVSERADRNLN